ncbi:MAG: BadF/BadG/BcrA/BcrD ATPase family protein [Pseudomonadota bacterium]
MSTHHSIGLGIDAGGTQTRWALCTADGALLAEGTVAGLSALQMASNDGRNAVYATFVELARQVLKVAKPHQVRAGLTGFGGDGDQLQTWLAGLLGIAPGAITLCNDIDIAYRASFAPGEGYLVYAGTGSIGAFIDASGAFHRAGGRGVVLDDGGGGFWIARAALRHIWRNEDECPGRWESSPMAHAVFDYVGGSDWAFSRQFIYGQERGAVGKLALAVAASAEQDPAALGILEDAGRELARLAQALLARFGPRPVVLSGRAAELHPAIAASMRASLPSGTILTHSTTRAHHAAARLAAADHTAAHTTLTS